MKKSIDRILLTILMFVLVLFGEGLTLRSYGLYVICGLIILYNIGHGKIFLNAELVLLLCFLLYSGLSYFWAMNTSLALYRTKVLTFLTILVVILNSQLRRTGGLYHYLNLYFIMGLILSLACIGYFGISGVIDLIISGIRLGEDEALFMGINANTIALDCATAGIIALFFSLIKNKKAYLLSLIPTTVIVVATGSRKGILMLMIGIVLAIFFYQRYRGGNKYSSFLKLMITVIVLFVIAGFALQMPGLEKINEQYMGFINSLIGREDEADISTLARGRMVTIGWEQFIRTPLLGIGLDNGKVINDIYNNFPAYLHNNYIEVLVNGGLIGFILYYSFYAVLLVKHFKRYRERNPFVYIALTLLIIRLISDWGRVSYFDYMSIMLYSFWISIANRYDLCFPNELKLMEGQGYESGKSETVSG